MVKSINNPKSTIHHKKSRNKTDKQLYSGILYIFIKINLPLKTDIYNH